MRKISALPPMTSADGDDEAPIVDDSATTTKKFTLTLLKEWLQSLVGWITTAMVGDKQITAAKIDLSTLGIADSIVNTQQSTSSTSYTDLSTTQSVTVNVQSTKALVFIGCMGSNNTNAATAWISVAVSGASTIAASDNNGAGQLMNPTTSGLLVGITKSMLITGLTPGSNTFTMKFRVTAGSGFYRDRYLVVIPL